MIPNPSEFLNRTERGSTVVDIGCYGWRLSDACINQGLNLIGVDQAEPPQRPSIARFAKSSGSQFDLPDDVSDVTVASHVLEHISNPVEFLSEMMRVTKPGGAILIEAPSELSAIPLGSSDPTDHRFVSFWDDPTHLRPWSPGALYRLALSCYCYPSEIERAEVGGIPVVRMIGIKPLDCAGRPPTAYVSLLNVSPGVESAWRHVWRKPVPAIHEEELAAE
jgi:SAM-dependent methyltransferase